jgi:ABC-2 type transport system ATP-binding protein
MTPSLEVQEISRFFQEYRALAPTSFSLKPGEVVVVSGQNGSGKTTLLHCLSGLLRPSGGAVRVGGYDLYEDEVEAKKRLAFVADIPRFYTELTAWEHLELIALAHSVQEGFAERAETLLNEMDLWEARDLYPHNYSRGMRLKLGLALAFIRPFDVLILDEPTSALDPQSVDQLVEKLRQTAAQGASVLFTSHNLSVIETLQAQNWVMEQGVLTPQAL